MQYEPVIVVFESTAPPYRTVFEAMVRGALYLSRLCFGIFPLPFLTGWLDAAGFAVLMLWVSTSASFGFGYCTL